MNIKRLIQNASVAFFAQGIAMCVSLVTTLLVPKVLGVEQYGYWQLFIFYTSYVGFCHLGLNDGVYLIYGGMSRKEIDKRSITSQMLVATLFQSILAIIIILLLAKADLGSERSFVLTATALYMVVKNLASYLGYIFQAMNETRLYSVSCILERVSFFIPMAVLLSLRIDSFPQYIFAYCIAGLIQLVYCLWLARDILCSGLEPPRLAIRQSIRSVRIGIKLMLANIASQLILGVARFVIDAVWDITAFGQLSLSLSMVNFFLAFVTQAAMVLFPALRQSTEHDQRRFFRAARDGGALLFPAVYLLYYPIHWLVGLWLPQYASSLVFFTYLLPICVFDSKMNIGCTTLFKVRRGETMLFRVNLVTTLISAFGTLIGAYLFNSIYAVIAAVTLAIVIRSVVSETLLTRELGIPEGYTLTIGELLVTLAFILVNTVSHNSGVAITIYLVVYGLYLVVNRSGVQNILKRIKRFCDKGAR